MFRDLGRQVVTTAKQAASGAVQGAGQSIGQRVRDLVAPGSKGRAAVTTAENYLPWIIGAAAVVGGGYLILRRR